jgi:prevent-host-death family protein
MAITTLTSREFNQDTARAKTAKGPVIITDRGSPSHVLLSYSRYLALSDSGPDIVALLGMAKAAAVDFEPPRASVAARSAELG